MIRLVGISRYHHAVSRQCCASARITSPSCYSLSLARLNSSSALQEEIVRDEGKIISPKTDIPNNPRPNPRVHDKDSPKKKLSSWRNSSLEIDSHQTPSFDQWNSGNNSKNPNHRQNNSIPGGRGGRGNGNGGRGNGNNSSRQRVYPNHNNESGNNQNRSQQNQPLNNRNNQHSNQHNRRPHNNNNNHNKRMENSESRMYHPNSDSVFFQNPRSNKRPPTRQTNNAHHNHSKNKDTPRQQHQQRQPENINNTSASLPKPTQELDQSLENLKQVFLTSVKMDREKKIMKDKEEQASLEETLGNNLQRAKQARLEQPRQQEQHPSQEKQFWRRTVQPRRQHTPQYKNNKYNSFREMRADFNSTFVDQSKSKMEQKKKRRQKYKKMGIASEIVLPSRPLSLKELSISLRVKIEALHEALLSLDGNFNRYEEPNPEQLLDMELAELLCLEMGCEPTFSTSQSLIDNKPVKEGTPRAPIISIMGHVDHGKTTLLDKLRNRSTTTKKSEIAGTEAGGITQKVSAFEVENVGTFFDTPGHSAFATMRSLGFLWSDVLILVVCCEDGVSEQTKEILERWMECPRRADIGLVVAMNKIDMLEGDEDRIRMARENVMFDLFPYGIDEEDIQLVPVSAKAGLGIEELMEAVLLQSDMMDLRGVEEKNHPMEGVVMDARMEKGRGVVVDCVVRDGTPKVGNWVVSLGEEKSGYGKIKSLLDVTGKTIKVAKPSQPVSVIGLKSLPKAGETIITVESEEVAENIVAQREQEKLYQNNNEQDDQNISKTAVEHQVTGSKAKRYHQFAQNSTEEDEDEQVDVITIPIIIKSDAEATLDSIKATLTSIPLPPHLQINCISTTIGPITGQDITMAQESSATIFCFGKTDKKMVKQSEKEGIKVSTHNIIYALLEEAKDIFASYLPKIEFEKKLGKAYVQAVFEVNKGEKIAGLRLTEGFLYRVKDDTGSNVMFRILNKKGGLKAEGIECCSLRKIKENVENVRKGDECGLGLSDFEDFQEGDTIECYSLEMKTQKL